MVVEELAAFLVAQGLATLKVDLWLHVAPDDPDDCAFIIEYAGDEPDFIQNDRMVEVERPRVQVTVRGEKPEVTRLRAERLYQSLMKIENESLSGTRYLSCIPIDTPAMIGRDESGRFLSTVNFRIEKELSNV
jgi:hypothetical protein